MAHWIGRIALHTLRQVLFALLLWGVTGWWCVSPSLADSQYRVLVLHSYHKGFKWTDDITQGIERVLRKAPKKVEISYEFMDTKRLSPEQLKAPLRSLFRLKYTPDTFDLILSSDDNAFDFLLENRHEIFGETPWVFCGVNYLEPARLIQEKEVTGVNEAADLWRGIDLALKLHPKTQTLYLVHDRTPTGMKVHRAHQQVRANLGPKVKLIDLDLLSMEELEQTLREVPKDSLVFYTLFLRDRLGHFYEYDESILRVVRASPVPVYVTWDFSIGSGAVGGYVTNGLSQGEAAAQLGLKILRGQRPADLPLQLFSPNRFVFDARALKRFEIDPSQLPKGSDILFRPDTAFPIEKNLLWIGLALFGAILAASLGLGILYLVRQREQRALRKSEARLRDMVENLPGGAIYIDANTFTFNRAAEEIIGYHRDEIGSLTDWHEALYPEQAEAMLDNWQCEARAGFPRTLRNQAITRKDGQVRYCDFSVYTEEGRTLVLMYDTTDRKRAEDALRQSELRHRILADHLPLNVFVKNRDLVYTFCNRAYAASLKRPPDQIVGKTDFELYPPELATFYQKGDQQVLTSGTPMERDEPLRLGGQTRTVHTLKAPLPDPTGAIIGVIGMYWDITEEREAEQRIRNALNDVRLAKEQIDAIIQTVSDGLIVTDAEGYVQVINEAAQEFLSGRLQTDRGGRIDDILAECPFRSYLETLFAHVDSSPVQDLTFPGQEGALDRVFEVRSSFLEGPAGDRRQAVTLMREVTRERELQRMKDEFIATAAHELRTPLTSIMGFSELLLNQDLEPEQRKDFVSEIYDSSNALSRRVTELLDLSRIESGRPIPLDCRPCSLRDKVTQTVRQYELQHANHQFSLALPQEDPADILADPTKIVQVLENLLSNAVKYSPGGGRIHIRQEATPAESRIIVEDDGIGMTRDQIQHIFDRFYRAEATGTRIPGLGIGMSIVKAIVDAHQGHITVDSTYGQGTRVTLRLPRQGTSEARG